MRNNVCIVCGDEAYERLKEIIHDYHIDVDDDSKIRKGKCAGKHKLYFEYIEWDNEIKPFTEINELLDEMDDCEDEECSYAFGSYEFSSETYDSRSNNGTVLEYSEEYGFRITNELVK